MEGKWYFPVENTIEEVAKQQKPAAQGPVGRASNPPWGQSNTDQTTWARKID